MRLCAHKSGQRGAAAAFRRLAGERHTPKWGADPLWPHTAWKGAGDGAGRLARMADGASAVRPFRAGFIPAACLLGRWRTAASPRANRSQRSATADGLKFFALGLVMPGALCLRWFLGGKAGEALGFGAGGLSVLTAAACHLRPRFYPKGAAQKHGENASLWVGCLCGGYILCALALWGDSRAEGLGRGALG